MMLIGYGSKKLQKICTLTKDSKKALSAHSADRIFDRLSDLAAFNNLSEIQGQRTLNSFDTKDLHQEVIIPAADSSFHGEAVLAGMLLQKRQCKASQPCEILRYGTLTSS